MQHEGGWKQTEERGEWEIVFISRKQGKQENKIQLPGEWGCLKQATFILTPFCYLKIRVYIGFSMLLTQRARNSTSAAALGDKLPAKIHFATCWRVRGNDDFPPARCQTGPGSPLVFSPMQGQQGRYQLWAVPQLWWQSWFSTWPYSWSVICKWAPCPLQSCATERISSTEAFLLCTKQANALTFTQTLELAQVHPNRFFPRLSSQILFAPPIKSHWFLLPLNLPLPECFWAVLRGNKKTTVGFHTSELSTASFLKVFNSLFLTFLFFQSQPQLWLPSSGAGQAPCPSLASISVPSSVQLPPSPKLIILPWIEHFLEYIISLLSVSPDCLLLKTYGEAFFLLEGWPSRQGFRSKLPSMTTRIAARARLQEIAKAQTKAFLLLIQTMFAGAGD